MELIEKNRQTIKVRKAILNHYNQAHDTDIKLADVGTWAVVMPCTSCDGYGFIFTGHRDDITRCQVCKDDRVYSTPEVSGKRSKYHYVTKTGKVIRHPSAYSKKGWSSMVYKSSQYFTLTVGLRWIAQSRSIKTKDIIKSGIAGSVYEVTEIVATPTV
jgi:hypothetical protein